MSPSQDTGGESTLLQTLQLPALPHTGTFARITGAYIGAGITQSAYL
jgi:hypothetical protein